MSTNHQAEFPLIFRDFVQMFADEAACASYLERLRWPDGFVCPACRQQQEPWRQTRGRLVCPDCRHPCTVTAGTIFDKTRTPLTTWFDAAWHVTTAKNGMSARTLERMMGIRYQVAWNMLHRFRVAMVRTFREPLSGEVEVDETMIGGVEQGGKRGRGANKEIVVIAVEIRHPGACSEWVWRHYAKQVATNGSGKLQTNSQTILKDSDAFECDMFPMRRRTVWNLSFVKWLHREASFARTDGGVTMGCRMDRIIVKPFFRLPTILLTLSCLEFIRLLPY